MFCFLQINFYYIKCIYILNNRSYNRFRRVSINTYANRFHVEEYLYEYSNCFSGRFLINCASILFFEHRDRSCEDNKLSTIAPLCYDFLNNSDVDTAMKWTVTSTKQIFQSQPLSVSIARSM